MNDDFAMSPITTSAFLSLAAETVGSVEQESPATLVAQARNRMQGTLDRRVAIVDERYRHEVVPAIDSAHRAILDLLDERSPGQLATPPTRRELELRHIVDRIGDRCESLLHELWTVDQRSIFDPLRAVEIDLQLDSANADGATSSPGLRRSRPRATVVTDACVGVNERTLTAAARVAAAAGA
jgi:hypothetical protein